MEEILRGTSDAICRALPEADQVLIRSLPVEVPFYGDILHAHAQGLADSSGKVIAQSGSVNGGEDLAFLRDALTEVVTSPATSITSADVEEARDDSVTEMGPSFHNRHLIALVRALERVSPLQGKALLRLLPQAFTYLNRIQATRAVDDAVRPSFELDGPSIVISHSLGSIVSFKLMRELKFKTPLFITIGSPLAIRAVQGPLGMPLGRRIAVERWCNFFDVDDFVTLGRQLSQDTFGRGIENTKVSNLSDDAHAHGDYLSQRELGRLICDAVRAT